MIAAWLSQDADLIAGDSMTNIVNLKEYKDAKAKYDLDYWAKFWIAYWFMLAGIK